MRTYCTRNGSCVGSDIGWSVSIPIQELTVGYSLTGRTQKAAQILLFMANHKCMATPISYFYKMAQVNTMHDKPACV